MTRRATFSALAVVAALTLGGCGGGGSSTPSATGGSSTPGFSQSPETPDGSPGSARSVVDGVTLSAEGSQLKLGQTARVSWKPDQTSVAVAAISVTALRKMPISAFADWRLDRATLRSTPYFVHATVRNLGRTPLSGAPVPLYLLDQGNTLLQASSFQAQYARCPSKPLPPRFTRNKVASVCLVYFVPRHGRLAAISFRPTQDFDAITWRGHVR